MIFPFVLGDLVHHGTGYLSQEACTEESVEPFVVGPLYLGLLVLVEDVLLEPLQRIDLL